MAQNLREYRRGTLRKHLSPNILTSSSFSLTSTNSLCHAMDSSFFSFEYAVTEFKAALLINFTSYILKWITLEAYRSNGILSRSCFVKTYFAFRRFLSFYSFFPLDSFRFSHLAALVTAPPVVFLLRRRRKTVTVDLWATSWITKLKFSPWPCLPTEERRALLAAGFLRFGCPDKSTNIFRSLQRGQRIETLEICDVSRFPFQVLHSDWH